MKHIYLDYAATTPVDPAVERAMRLYGSRVFGNPSSVHWWGQQASAAVFVSRQMIAKALGVSEYREVIFTGSATEANNLALRGIIKSLESKIKDRRSKIITTVIEHESILETCRDLEEHGLAEVVYLPVDQEGLVDLEKLKAALDERTVLISIQYANSEIGVIQPISKIVGIIEDFKKSFKDQRLKVNDFYPLLHTDAVQAFPFLTCKVDELGVDLMTLSAHKVYGPKGVGVLYLRRKYASSISALINGGGQEFGLRSGTENVSLIVGCGKAVELAERLRLAEWKRLRQLCSRFWKGLKKIFPAAELNGSWENRLPHNLNVYFPGSSAHDRCIELDLCGIAVSPGAACSARRAEPSPVIAALGYDGDRPRSSLRFTLGRPTTAAELDKVLEVLKNKFRKNYGRH